MSLHFLITRFAGGWWWLYVQRRYILSVPPYVQLRKRDNGGFSLIFPLSDSELTSLSYLFGTPFGLVSVVCNKLKGI